MIKTTWDYTQRADGYLSRPDYAPEAIQDLMGLIGLPEGRCADIGAGVGHLTRLMATYPWTIDAVEPNDAMRKHGIKQTESFSNVNWFEGTAEHTGLPSNSYDLISFGSSFNVVDRPAALTEVKRISKKSAWFACLWNHRDLNDPIQEKIERTIHQSLPEYHYGKRREDHKPYLESVDMFNRVHFIEKNIVHAQTKEQCVQAWRSHATLARQAGSKFDQILNKIEAVLDEVDHEIQIPYTTVLWACQIK